MFFYMKKHIKLWNKALFSMLSQSAIQFTEEISYTKPQQEPNHYMMQHFQRLERHSSPNRNHQNYTKLLVHPVLFVRHRGSNSIYQGAPGDRGIVLNQHQMLSSPGPVHATLKPCIGSVQSTQAYPKKGTI